MTTSEREEKVAALLREAAETHHTVYRIVDGTDDDWASWYSDWLIRLSELPEVLGAAPVRSELTAALVAAARREAEALSGDPWPEAYARAIAAEFARD